MILNVGDENNNYQVIEIAKTAADLITDCKVKFLSDYPDLDTAGVIKDRKVDGKDSRTYKVSFKKLKDYLNGYQCNKTLEVGLQEMVNKFSEINLTTSVFESYKYYRLQALESKINLKLISENLEWL